MQGDPSVHVEGMLSSGCSSSFGSERPAVSDWASALSWGGGEAELVHELQAGSETAFDWLVTHYHAPVYNLILGMLGDTSDAADGTQEVFLKAFRGIRKFRQGSSQKPDRKSTRLNSSHVSISYAVFCLKKKKKK